MQIREATRADAPQIVRLFHDTIHTVNRRDYTQEQGEAWSPSVPDAAAWAERKFPTRTTFVADDDGTIVGFGELEGTGHIDCFYCHHDYPDMQDLFKTSEYRNRGYGACLSRAGVV